MSVAEFWAVTPGQLLTAARVYRRRRRDEEQTVNYRLYLLASMTASFVWATERPSFETLFGGGNKTGGMTDRQMLDMVRGLNRAMGGTEDAAIGQLFGGK